MQNTSHTTLRRRLLFEPKDVVSAECVTRVVDGCRVTVEHQFSLILIYSSNLIGHVSVRSVMPSTKTLGVSPPDLGSGSPAKSSNEETCEYEV